MLVTDFLERSAERLPEKTALVCDGGRYSYAELDARANRLAHALRSSGVARGDRVAIFQPNGAAAVVSIFAALKADAVFVVVHPTVKAAKLQRLIDDCRAKVLLTSDRAVETARRLLRTTESLQAVFVDGLPEGSPPAAEFIRCEAVQEAYPPTRPVRRNIDLDLACLVYTSGSSGEAKGVMCPHAAICFAAQSITTYLQQTVEDVVISALPLAFDYGLYQLLMAFQTGSTLVLERSFAYPAQFLNHLVAEQATGLPGVPTMFALLLQMDLAAYDLSQVRYLTNTGAALPPNHIRRLQALFPNARVYSMYGLTETKRTLYLPPEELSRRPDSVGVAIPGTEVWLEDEAGRRLPPNQIGELVIRGRHVMRGYWGRPEETAHRFRAGPIPGEMVCYSGDLFRMDEDGFFYFVGRKDDVIKSRGEKVSPKEIENVLCEMPGVSEAAVVGVPDEILGQAIKAYVVTNGHGLSETDVLRHCRAHLEELLVPHQVVLVESLPKSSNGKIQKSQLV